MYLLAIFLPLLVCIVHACLVVSARNSERQTRSIVRAIQERESP
jgi:HAMP domain-containing protein